MRSFIGLAAALAVARRGTFWERPPPNLARGRARPGRKDSQASTKGRNLNPMRTVIGLAIAAMAAAAVAASAVSALGASSSKIVTTRSSGEGTTRSSS